MNRLLPFLLLMLWVFPAFADEAFFQEQLLEANLGNAEAQLNLGLLYDNGEGVPENNAEAAKWYRKAANQGNTGAQYNLGVKYYNGEGVPENDVKAYSWWSVAKAQDHKDATYNLKILKNEMTKEQIAQGQALATKCWESEFQECD